jgi:hypothetical protein
MTAVMLALVVFFGLRARYVGNRLSFGYMKSDGRALHRNP